MRVLTYEMEIGKEREEGDVIVSVGVMTKRPLIHLSSSQIGRGRERTVCLRGPVREEGGVGYGGEGGSSKSLV